MNTRSFAPRALRISEGNLYPSLIIFAGVMAVRIFMDQNPQAPREAAPAASGGGRN